MWSVMRKSVIPFPFLVEGETLPAGESAVQSVDTDPSMRLIDISRPGTKSREMTFVLNPSTHREGTIEVGSTVSVRYQEEGKTHVASALISCSSASGGVSPISRKTSRRAEAIAASSRGPRAGP